MVSKLLIALWIISISAIGVGITATSWALSPEHEAERLTLAAEEALESNQYSKAANYLEKAQGLGAKMPENFDFLYGKVLSKKGSKNRALTHLEKYVNATGKEGQYYRDALKLITRIKENSNTRKISTGKASPPQISWSTGSKARQAYLDKLQMLYMSDSGKGALVQHINSLLSFYGSADSHIRAARKLPEITNQQITTSSGGEIISLRHLSQTSTTNKEEQDRFPVYGVDPYVAFKCSNSSVSCWLIHPISKKTWLSISHNRQGAEELSKAMTTLIKTMQHE